MRQPPSWSAWSAASIASSGTSTSPSSPSVQVTSVTCAPSAAYLAIVAPVPMVSSSGWACTSNRLRSVMPHSVFGAGTIGRVSFPLLNARTARFTLGRPRSFAVAPDGSRITFLRSPNGFSRETWLWVYDVETRSERQVADPVALLSSGSEDIPDAERARRERAREHAGGIVGYATDAACTQACFALAGRLFVADLLADGAREVEARTPVFDPRFDPTGRRVA